MVSLLSIILKIGFQSKATNFEYDFGNCKLIAIQTVNKYFTEGIQFLGYNISAERAEEFDFFIPLEVESHEQGIAFIAFNLRNAKFTKIPVWLKEGHNLQDELPWEKLNKAFKENPEASIEHEWFRILVNKLRLQISISTDEDTTTFSFSDNILKVVCNDEILVVSGKGKDWQSVAKVKTKSLNSLPKKILKKNIQIYIWDGYLHVGNRIYIIEVN